MILSPPVFYLLTCHRRLGKRAVIFHTAGGLGQLFSGFLQAAAYNNLEGVRGLEGWRSVPPSLMNHKTPPTRIHLRTNLMTRWLMIICFIISLPIALANFVFLLDMPWKAKPNWLFTEAELKLANTRLRKEGRAPASKITLAKVRSNLLLL